MSFFATVEHEKERLQYFASPKGRDDLYQYNQKERRTVLEVQKRGFIDGFWGKETNGPEQQSHVDSIRGFPFSANAIRVAVAAGSYSISSSPLAHPNQVHLTVNVSPWTTLFKRKRMGLCSKWLTGLDPQQGVIIHAWFVKGSLPAPPPSLPLILIGPGTGCAPFHGFVEERAVQSRSCSTGPGAFGREGWRLLRGLLKGGRTKGLCAAKDAREEPEDLEFVVFEEIVSKENGFPRESAVRWLRAMVRAGKYHVEAGS
ncbi:NADPH-dependent diflavin oxidoreductase 1 [Vitis vinifera]|uniref:NADPH-dependent diflavin oxidoreductase 1 n=1 Tax=Vitis vinifera TaxID=29760 RepID=A0A438DM10_VITVI|nr:NADPH-dependent diflavin oxidoreductase 1 [Vitis vinifera]